MVSVNGALAHDDVNEGKWFPPWWGLGGHWTQGWLGPRQVVIGEDETDIAVAVRLEMDAGGVGVLLDVAVNALAHHGSWCSCQ